MGDVLYHSRLELGVGEVQRYIVSYDNQGNNKGNKSLWLKVKNISRKSYRAGYIIGPFMIYCDIRSQFFDHNIAVSENSIEPRFKANIIPQHKFITEIPLHMNSKYNTWVIDVVSEILFSKNCNVPYELLLGTTKYSLKGSMDSSKLIDDPSLKVEVLNSCDLWKIPRSTMKDPDIHLVVLTHGMHSNGSADLLYMKEEICKIQDPNSNMALVVEGFNGNVCETEKGIKYQGIKLANYIIDTLYHEKVLKISFIGHSLGGLVQSFAIAYISIKYPSFFTKVKPENFITLASPLIGIASSNPGYVKYSLTSGLVGRTGQDLTFTKDIKNDTEPLLYLLSGEPLHSTLRMFRKRTVYANAMNDGIVQLHTSSLLYLDFDEFLPTLQKMKGKKKELKKIPKVSIFDSMTSILVPPKPDMEYIIDPKSRDEIIIHDKIYSQSDISRIESRYGDSILKSFVRHNRSYNGENVQLLTARRWHEDMTWRKVVVALKQEAHNSIIVRRRFSNAYGWPVIDNLIQTHFGHSDQQDTSLPGVSAGIISWSNEPNKALSWLIRVENAATYHGGILSLTSKKIEKTFIKTSDSSKIVTSNEMNQFEPLTTTELNNLSI